MDEKTPEELAAIRREALRLELAAAAVHLPALQADLAAAIEERRAFREERDRMAKKWAEADTKRDEVVRALQRRVEDAAWKRNRLLAEYVDRSLIERESQAESLLNRLDSDVAKAQGDLDAHQRELDRARTPQKGMRGGKPYTHQANPERAKHYQVLVKRYAEALTVAKDAYKRQETLRDNLTRQVLAAYNKVCRDEA